MATVRPAFTQAEYEAWLRQQPGGMSESNLQHENNLLREMLAMAYSGPSNLYMDDGELMDTTQRPFIDYRRDTVEEIYGSMTMRGFLQVKPTPSLDERGERDG